MRNIGRCSSYGGVSVIIFGGWNVVKGAIKNKIVEKIFGRKIIEEYSKKYTVKTAEQVIDAEVGLNARALEFGLVTDMLNNDTKGQSYVNNKENNYLQVITEGIETKSNDTENQNNNKIGRATEFSDWVESGSAEFKLVEEY